jgi:hypothetical protein
MLIPLVPPMAMPPVLRKIITPAVALIVRLPVRLMPPSM